jgi:outer membrane immunogenic protein
MAVRKSLMLAFAVVGISGPALAQFAGTHVGGQGGIGVANQDQTGGQVIPTTPTTTFVSVSIGDGRYNLFGGLVGGTIGYDWQNGPYVFGLEGDGSWADITGSGTCGPPAHGCGGSIRALGTIRARLGYDIGRVSPWGGDVLAYVTGGWAVGDVHAWDSLFGNSGDKTASGWTVGAGLEAMFAPNWSVKLEYLHVDLGNPAVFTAIPPFPEHVSTTAEIVRIGINYHFGWTPPAEPPPVVTKARPYSK